MPASQKTLQEWQNPLGDSINLGRWLECVKVEVTLCPSVVLHYREYSWKMGGSKGASHPVSPPHQPHQERPSGVSVQACHLIY